MSARSLVLILLALAGVMLTGSPSAAEPRPHPRLTLAGAEAVTVRGSGFRRQEHVRVVMRQATGAPVVRRVTAGRSGRFSAEFPGPKGPCGRLTVSATGSLGSHASLIGAKYPNCVAF